MGTDLQAIKAALADTEIHDGTTALPVRVHDTRVPAALIVVAACQTPPRHPSTGEDVARRVSGWMPARTRRMPTPTGTVASSVPSRVPA